ncbi:MAG: EthD family reductase [Ilumatobacter sp.]|nr:MAG: EthD family reductase [Ilumatobacter sp.]
MIRLISFLKRKPGSTHAEFLEHWRDVHAPLIANSSAARYVRRYEQHPAAWPEDGGSEPSWDGVTIQEFGSTADFWAHVQEPDFPEMQADIERFIDTSDLPWLLVDDANVVIDGSSTGDGARDPEI